MEWYGVVWYVHRAGKLHTYFAQHNYHFVTALYGNHFDGYMVST